MDPMQKAAKEKTFILWIVASVALFCAPSFASSVRDLPAENRVEIFLPEGQNRTVQQAFDTANRVENYDSAWGVASESSVAPIKGLAKIGDLAQAERKILQNIWEGGNRSQLPLRTREQLAELYSGVAKSNPAGSAQSAFNQARADYLLGRGPNPGRSVNEFAERFGFPKFRRGE